jgi:hypothetical protein
MFPKDPTAKTSGQHGATYIVVPPRSRTHLRRARPHMLVGGHIEWLEGLWTMFLRLEHRGLAAEYFFCFFIIGQDEHQDTEWFQVLAKKRGERKGRNDLPHAAAVIKNREPK